MIPASLRPADWLSPRFAAAALWVAALAVLGAVQFLITRACGYELRPVISYAAYFLFHVGLPGVVVMAALNRGPVSLALAVALGIPTGFAIEIFSYIGLSALGAKEWIRVLPLCSMAGLSWFCLKRGDWPVRCRLSGRHAGLALAMSALFLATVVAAASHMFAESPLVAGLPQRPIFHDWVYLVSRAAAIKNFWPLEDPSLAGTSLQYHYFLLVHAASASWVTGTEITLVLLRLIVLPLGAVLVAQAYVLGRRASGRAWGGVLAAFLTVAAGEVAFSTSPHDTLFLGRFIRWLYVSPTFYFGVIFFGAVLIAVERWRAQSRFDPWQIAWLALIGGATTGAKGTVMPVLLTALALWGAWRWLGTRIFPTRLAVAGVVLATAFALVYQATMAGWGAGAAAFVPFDVFHVSDFWRQEFPRWEAWLAQWLPHAAVLPLASIGCGFVVLAGTDGVRLLALPYLLMRHRPAQQPIIEWLGAAFLVSGAMGGLMKLDADGELYLFLLMRLPTAVLTAACLMEAARRMRVLIDLPVVTAGSTGAARPIGFLKSAAAWGRWSIPIVVAMAIVAMLAAQSGTWWLRNRVGFADWMRDKPGLEIEADMLRLREALLWVRRNTEPDAVLVANSCTPTNLKNDHWGALDRTLTGVHYYYSALSERRLFVEGPNYLLHPERISRRMDLAADVFYRHRAPSAEMFGGMPCYAVVDHSIRDGAEVALTPDARVFANARIEIYRMPPRDTRTAAVIPAR